MYRAHPSGGIGFLARLFLAISLLIVFASIKNYQADGIAGEPIRTETVVLVSVDGLAAGYLDDPAAPLPHLRQLASEGAVARGMITACPSVTWPSHVTLITGVWPSRHGVIGNSVFDRQKNRIVTYIGDPELTKSQAVRAVTLYDVLHRSGRSSASIIWPCSSGADSLRWVIPDSNRAELHQRFTTPGLVDELLDAGIDIRPLAQWGWDKNYMQQRDALYTKVACYLIEKYRPALVLVHLIQPDGVEHASGPYTQEAYRAVGETDVHIGTLWQLLQTPPFRDRAALFVVSDHGFAPYEKLIQPAAVLRELGEIVTDPSGKVLTQKTRCVSQGGTAFVYVLGEDKQQRLPQIKDAMQKLEGVADVLTADQLASLGLPTPDVNAQAPDFLLNARPGYSFSDNLAGPAIVPVNGLRGAHGHLPQPSFMHATFVAAGAGIRKGVKLDVIQSIDVAPTIARLLQIELPDAEGRVLHEILSSAAPQ
jgi:predicted AlkP superfamily pyrophosphatase or phosphodiesterase